MTEPLPRQRCRAYAQPAAARRAAGSGRPRRSAEARGRSRRPPSKPAPKPSRDACTDRAAQPAAARRRTAARSTRGSGAPTQIGADPQSAEASILAGPPLTRRQQRLLRKQQEERRRSCPGCARPIRRFELKQRAAACGRPFRLRRRSSASLRRGALSSTACRSWSSAARRGTRSRREARSWRACSLRNCMQLRRRRLSCPPSA